MSSGVPVKTPEIDRIVEAALMELEMEHPTSSFAKQRRMARAEKEARYPGQVPANSSSSGSSGAAAGVNVNKRGGRSRKHRKTRSRRH